MINLKNNWLKGPLFDSLFILLPSFFAVTFVFYLGEENHSPLPLWMWVVFVMGIDVSHVYSTLFKTYFHSKEFEEKKTLLTMAPILVWTTGMVVYSLSPASFWTILAYLAVFHFVRQQYGFMRLYDSHAGRLDSLAIYAGALYPVFYWHTHPREFYWFIEGDFLQGLPVIVEKAAFLLYCLILGTYFFREFFQTIKTREFNAGKNLIVMGTVLSWYIGIVWFNGDIAFTVTNIVSHGIPYMALIWIWGNKNETKHFNKSWGAVFFIGLLLVFAYIEEGFWAGLVWREHLEVFNVFSCLPAVKDKATLSWLVPLLTLPQAVHYLLDGFIWKRAKKH